MRRLALEEMNIDEPNTEIDLNELTTWATVNTKLSHLTACMKKSWAFKRPYSHFDGEVELPLENKYEL